jgi:hypothetical protein
VNLLFKEVFNFLDFNLKETTLIFYLFLFKFLITLLFLLSLNHFFILNLNFNLSNSFIAHFKFLFIYHLPIIENYFYFSLLKIYFILIKKSIFIFSHYFNIIIKYHFLNYSINYYTRMALIKNLINFLILSFLLQINLDCLNLNLILITSFLNFFDFF